MIVARWTGRSVAAVRFAVLVLACIALVGCGASPAPAPAGSIPPAPATGGASATPALVVLPWPAGGAAEAAALQAAVDGGAQPWLLDPTEVALSYVAAAHGWTGAAAAPGGPTRGPAGTTVEVGDPTDGSVTVTLAQPGRTGPTGIWVVTTERRA